MDDTPEKKPEKENHDAANVALGVGAGFGFGLILGVLFIVGSAGALVVLIIAVCSS